MNIPDKELANARHREAALELLDTAEDVKCPRFCSV